MVKKYKRYCNTCGKYYVGRGEKYCSHACRPAWNKGLTKDTDERVKKISLNHADVSGSKNPRYGKIGELHPAYGHKDSEETRKKKSENHWDNSGKNNPNYGRVGNKHPMFGKHHTSETIEKMSESQKKSDNSGRFKKGQQSLRKGKKHKSSSIELIKEARKHRIFPTSRTKPELKFLEIVNKYNLPYKYTGDGSFWVGNVNPDFVNCNGEKICVEIWGDYWHKLPKEIEKDKKRLKTLEEFGWKRIEIWECEVMNSSAEEILKNKHFLEDI